MADREEVESALRFAREEYERATNKYRDAEPESAPEQEARRYCLAWAGRIDAYEFVLGLKPGRVEPDWPGIPNNCSGCLVCGSSPCFCPDGKPDFVMRTRTGYVAKARGEEIATTVAAPTCIGLGRQYPHAAGTVDQCPDCGDYLAEVNPPKT